MKLRVALLPHDRFPRRCVSSELPGFTPGFGGDRVVVSHCLAKKKGKEKEDSLRDQGLWMLRPDWEEAAKRRGRASRAKGASSGSWPAVRATSGFGQTAVFGEGAPSSSSPEANSNGQQSTQRRKEFQVWVVGALLA